jgi:hypothetical protein
MNAWPFQQAILLVAGLVVLMGHGTAARADTSTPRQNVSIDHSVSATLKDADYRWIGQRIYQNECAGQERYLTHWGEGEEFPSLGIAHFIWFPKGVDTPFEETFPDLFAYLSQSTTPPAWLSALWTQSGQKTTQFDAPWPTQTHFEQAWSSIEMTELRGWLLATRSQQAGFVVRGFERRWQQTLHALPPKQAHALNAKMRRFLQFKAGTFAVIDYFNFKGIGSNAKERYQGYGWGLIEVLQAIPDRFFNQPDDHALLKAFVESAKQRLQGRVERAPPKRNEARWLTGWFKRLDGYLHE